MNKEARAQRVLKFPSVNWKSLGRARARERRNFHCSYPFSHTCTVASLLGGFFSLPPSVLLFSLHADFKTFVFQIYDVSSGGGYSRCKISEFRQISGVIWKPRQVLLIRFKGDTFKSTIYKTIIEKARLALDEIWRSVHLRRIPPRSQNGGRVKYTIMRSVAKSIHFKCINLWSWSIQKRYKAKHHTLTRRTHDLRVMLSGETFSR